MTDFPYDLTEAEGRAATLGLIVLQVDETIEQDFRRLLPGPDIALYVTRIPSGADLTPDTIARMERDLPGAAALLPPAARFGAVGYACTSGTTLIGVDRVEELVQQGCTTEQVCNPLTATQAALRRVGARRIGLVSPYSASIAADMRKAFEAAGFELPRAISFGEEVEAKVARIDPRSIATAARAVAAGGGIDAVFLSCTNLRTLGIIEGLEKDLGLPVISSNLSLAWPGTWQRSRGRAVPSGAVTGCWRKRARSRGTGCGDPKPGQSGVSGLNVSPGPHTRLGPAAGTLGWSKTSLPRCRGLGSGQRLNALRIIGEADIVDPRGGALGRIWQMHDHPHHDNELDEMTARARALETILVEKGLVDPAAVDAIIDTYEHKVGPRNGAAVVARAWSEPGFADWLRDDATAAIASMGFIGRQGEHMQALFNTPEEYNLVVCTLCSCYPWPVLGLPPTWYKAPAYRSRAVRDPRGVLAEFGVDLPETTHINVWDSTAEIRYLVIPERPEGTEGMDAAALADLVTRDSMIGCGQPHRPETS